MDEKMKHLREIYKNETSFSEKERHAIMSKAKHESSNKSGGPLFPFKIAIPLVATLLIAFIIFASNDGGPLFQPTTGSPGEVQDEQGPTTDGEPSIEGYVMKSEDDRILIVEPRNKDTSSYTAVWYSDYDSDIEIGQKVKAWHSEQEDSEPPHAVPELIQVVESDVSSENTTLTEHEALKRAIDATDLNDFSIPVVRKLVYIEQRDEWEIKVEDAYNDHYSLLRVEDTLEFRVGSFSPTDTIEDDQIPEPNIEDIITEFENAYDRLIETDDEQRLVNFDSTEEIREDFTNIMNEEFVDYYLDTYVDEEDGELYIIPTGMEVFIDLEQDYEVNEVSDTEYHVIQEVNYEFTDHIELTYLIEYHDENWIVQDVLYDPIDE
ncbi:DUF3221 domain-containing protein [Alkalibacillus haloalkaliphilus]|uniref:Uncharacterized protein n=1 Tax=Alkalibacillus haloalkaliphilus TaxID=94136 RepID=A0A511W4S9_9BACI|nr:DUF3221 domain-containing protein [Alkalibacillus haloalkaliphilus]GEN46085.1 hypothetical protein AHA02nite_18610 [Alkalibacillus haloalkaliphilus]